MLGGLRVYIYTSPRRTLPEFPGGDFPSEEEDLALSPPLAPAPPP